MFTAEVVDGEEEPKTHRLIFDLRGEGALPTIRLDKPDKYSDDQMALLEFSKTHIGKTIRKVLIAKCDGAIPSTAKFILNPHPAFRFTD